MTSAMTTTLDLHAPLQPVKPRVRSSAPWMTSEILDARRQRRGYERSWLKALTEANRKIYRHECNHVKYLIQEAKRRHISTSINESISSQKLLFQTFDRLTNKHTTNNVIPTIFPPPNLPDKFATYFGNKIE